VSWSQRAKRSAERRTARLGVKEAGSEAVVTKARRRRSGGRATKVDVLTRGDLALRLKGRRWPRGHWSEKSAEAIVCAGQRMSQEDSSPSGARMRSTVSKGGVMPRQPAAEAVGRQGVWSDPESEGFEEKYRAAINGGHPDDEQVGQRWGKVEPALWGRRRYSFTHRTKVFADGTIQKIHA
jgi:hypothetical protein